MGHGQRMANNFTGTVLTETLKRVLNSVLPVTDEGRVVVGETGLRITASDQANIGMVYLSLGRELFIQYDYPEGSEPFEVGMDFTKLHQIVQLVNEGSVDIGFDDAKVYLETGSYEYTLSQLEVSTLKADPKVPELEFLANPLIAASELQRAFRAASKLQTDNVTLSVMDKVFCMRVDNGIGDKLEFSLGADTIEGLDKVTEDCSSKYNLLYLARMVKGISDASGVTLRLRSDYPLSIEFSLGSKESAVQYLIAPRITD